MRFNVQEKDGWYHSEHLDRIKRILRLKFFSLLDGVVVSDQECITLLDTTESTVTSRQQVLRVGKHNMAKGARPPEEMTVCPSSVLIIIGT